MTHGAISETVERKKLYSDLKNLADGLCGELDEIREYYASKWEDARYHNVSYEEWIRGSERYLKKFKEFAEETATLCKSRTRRIKGKLNHLDDLVDEIDIHKHSVYGIGKISSSVFFMVEFCDYLLDSLENLMKSVDKALKKLGSEKEEIQEKPRERLPFIYYP